MLVEKPLKGTVVFEFTPALLTSSRKAYTEAKWFDLEYFNQRLNSGLLYSTKEGVLKRIEMEQSILRQRKQEGL